MSQALPLYRSMLRSARRFPTYNFREYFSRRVREDFRAARDSSMSEAQQDAFLAAQREKARALARQSTISSLYSHTRLVVE
eukprot:CAMPEP_0177647846 /NCGR_PEP_ID=MMETSP0447-20121125/10515_1 /TAXON_ID=0 /ORGANISM="Stygamoeba regulata, Strain BSH-02190019" /LENGTH=80 /DNA_ID=CAMNT_0019150453 /DNA_START=73 /DNA_END=315 /DNA_ORIENTATION=-